MENLTEKYKGALDDGTGRIIEGDNYNELLKAKDASRCVIAGKVDTDPHGRPNGTGNPFYPGKRCRQRSLRQRWPKI